MTDDKERLAALAQVCPPAAEEFARLPELSWSGVIQIGQILRSGKFYAEAAAFFDAAYAINRKSSDVLGVKLLSQIEGGLNLDNLDLEALNALDPHYFQFVLGAQVAARPEASPEVVLGALRNCFESFRSGSAPDWLYLRQAYALLQRKGLTAQGNGPEPRIPRRVFFYWDKDPPQQVADNIEYHRALGGFEIQLYSKERAVEFISEFFGADCKRLFLSMRHPSEESDFFRFHVIYALGGYYLDVDEAVKNPGRLIDVSGSFEGVFLLSGSGPVESAFFGATASSPVITECLRVHLYNCHYYPDLSMWLKGGPGPITRSLVRICYRTIAHGLELPSFVLLPSNSYGGLFRGVEMPYREDVRDWRIYEAEQRKMQQRTV